MKRKILIGGLVAIVASLAWAANETRTLLNELMPVTTTKTFDVGKYDRFTVQAVYAEASPSADTVSDGSNATASITVANHDQIDATRAATSITVVSTSNITGDSITLNGIVFTNGTDWITGGTTATTAENLRAKIDAHPDFVATRASNVVYASATLVGTYANGWAATTTDAVNLTISSSTFLGGVNAESVTIAGVTLTEGTDWEAQTSSAVTAGNIKDAIEADSTLSALLTVSTATLGVVSLTATDPGIFPYGISSSSAAALAISPFTNGSASDIDIDTDEISATAHGFETGLQVYLTVLSGTEPTGLTDGTTYYVIKKNENSYKLATNANNALAGTAIDITALIGSGSFTFTPGAFAKGSVGFAWYGSNDNSNWTELTSFSSVTYSSDGNSLWDFDTYDYRYLRMNYTGPTSGALDIDVILNGKTE